MKQQNEKQRINKPSTLLSQDENDTVFSLLGRRCQTMSTAVIQLFTTEAPAHSVWIKRLSGIACFVKDSSKRSYFIRVYCMLKHSMIWEEEMYETISMNKPREFMITFEGQDCMVALSFASDDEANNFYKTATQTVANRTKRRRSRKFSPTKTEATQENGYDSGVILRNPRTGGMDQFSQMQQNNAAAGLNKKRPNRKLTKADISTPTNFKHLAHVGWNDQKCFELNSDEISNLDMFLKKAGVSEQQLNDRDTRAYIYDFIQSRNVLDLVKSEKQQPPPPVPSRNPTQRTAPPPPPPQNIQTRPAAQLPSSGPARAAAPKRPPPMKKMESTTQIPIPSNIPIPPPPPPMFPPVVNQTISPIASNNQTNSESSSQSVPAPPKPVPVVDDSRGALMDSIRKGIQLRKVDPATLSTGSGSGSGSGDARNDLLSEIRQGIELRPAAERELTGTRESVNRGTDALADALRRALQERSRVLRSSDEEDDTSDNEEWD